MTRMALTATLVCLASWAGLAIGAGNVGLQQAVSDGPLTLLEHPLAVILSAVLAFIVTVALTTGASLAARDGPPLVGAVLVGDAIGAVVIAPILIGELQVRDAPTVFVVLATLGLQPVAVASARLVHQRMART